MQTIEALFGKQPEKKITTIDRSDLQDYAECPLRPVLKAKSKTETQPNLLMVIGTEGHRLVEEAIKENIDDAVAIAEYVEAELPKLRPDIQPKAVKALRHLCGILLKIKPEQILKDLDGKPFIEYQIDNEILPGVIITTCVDLVKVGIGALHVHDWKTGFKKRSREDVETDFQTCVICYILWQMFPDIDTIYFWYEETFWGNSAFGRLERNACVGNHPDLTTENVFNARIVEAVRIMQSGSEEAWPLPKKCLWCDVKQECNKCHMAVNDLAKNPKEYLEAYVIMEATLKERKGHIVDYLKGGNELKTDLLEARKKMPAQKFNLEIVPVKEET